MTAKEIYEIIDLNELPKEKADKLRELEVKTNGFSIQNDRVDETMRNLYAQLKEKKPSALKDLKVEIKKVETKKGDDVIIKETEEIVGKKKVTQKNPTPSSSKKETITEVAKKIRKEGEEWRQALRRAGEEMRKRDDEASKQVKTELQKLIDFVKNDPNFKDFPRTYGKGRKDIDLLKDASEKALAPGRRVSKKGHMNQFGASKGGRKYTENRDNRSDREASKFPKNIFLAKGGSVHRAELMEEGGEIFVPVQILANNPDALVNTTTMSQLFAEGGMAPTRKLFEDGGAINQGNTDAEYITYGEVLKSGGKLKYDPARDVQAIVIQDGPFKLMFIKGDFLGGAYRLANGGLSEDYNYVSPRKVIFARLKSGEDIKPSNGFWIKKNATGTFYTGKEKAKPAFKKTLKFPLPKAIKVDGPYSQNEKIMKMLGTFSANEAFLRPALSFVRIQEGELISTNAHIMIRLYDNSVEGKNEFICASNACKKVSESERKELSNPGYKQVLNSASVDFSEKYNLGELYEALMGAREEVYSKLEKRSKNTYVVIDLELKNNSLSFDSMLLLTSVKAAIELGWKNAYISYQESKSKAIYITEDKLTTNSSYAVLDGKDVILIMPIATSAGFENVKTIEAQQVMADGGILEQRALKLFNKLKEEGKLKRYLDTRGNGKKYFETIVPNYAENGYWRRFESTSRGSIGVLQDRYLDKNDVLNHLKKTMPVLKENDKMADGGEVFVPVQMLANNPDALVQTTSMSDLFADGGSVEEKDSVYEIELFWKGLERPNKVIKSFYVSEHTLDKIEMRYKYDLEFDVEDEHDFEDVSDKISSFEEVEEFLKKDWENKTNTKFAKGGYVDLQANLMKELQKLQRDLNSPRLSRYTEGDNSQEEMARQRERASKLARFNEILDLLRELESKKMADGGVMDDISEVKKYAIVDENTDRIYIRNTNKEFIDLKYKELKEIYPNDKLSIIEFEKGGIMAEGGFVAMYGGKKINIEADSLYAAKLKAIEEFKVPKSKQGLLSVVSNKSMANQDFRFMEDGGRLEAQSLEMAQNVSVQITHHAMELKEALDGKTYIEPWVTSMLQRAADNLSDATHYLEGKEEKMAKGGKIREWDDVLILSKNRLGMVELIFNGIYYITTPRGERFEATIDDLQKIVSFKEGGDVKIGEIAMIAKENKATGDEVVKKISAGADVEMEHTEDRKVAMRIASDHLKEDFNYYEKLRKAGL